MRSSWLVQVSPVSISNCPLRDTRRRDKGRMGMPFDREAQIGGVGGKEPQAKENLKWPEAARGKDQVFQGAPPLPRAGFQASSPQNCGRANFCCCKLHGQGHLSWQLSGANTWPDLVRNRESQTHDPQERLRREAPLHNERM